MSFYAVAKGRVPGIYATWTECSAQVHAFSGARYKKFNRKEDANKFILDNRGEEHFVTTNTIPSIKNITGPPLLPVEASITITDTKIETDDTCIVFTDGACTNNGNENAKAAWAVVWPYHQEFNASDLLPSTSSHTNIRAEGSAIINAIIIANKNIPTNIGLAIYTDSKLWIDIITKYLPSWNVNGWRRRGGEIANLDLVRQLDTLMTTRKVSFFHVYSHTGDKTFKAIWNDAVDKLAAATAV